MGLQLRMRVALRIESSVHSLTIQSVRHKRLLRAPARLEDLKKIASIVVLVYAEGRSRPWPQRLGWCHMEVFEVHNLTLTNLSTDPLLLIG